MLQPKREVREPEASHIKKFIVNNIRTFALILVDVKLFKEEYISGGSAAFLGSQKSAFILDVWLGIQKSFLHVKPP